MIKIYHVRFMQSNVSDETVEIYTRFHRDSLVDTTAREVLLGKYAGSLEYVHVANIYNEGSLHNIYQLTNNIDGSWINNLNVVNVEGRDGYRSSSVGDIFENENGDKFLVNDFGFTKL